MGWIIFALLLLQWCQYSSCQTQPWDSTSISRDSISSLSFYGWPETNSTIELHGASPGGSFSNKSPSQPNFSELNYSSMLGWIFFKMWLDCKTFSREAMILSDRFLGYSFENAKGLSIEFLNNLLWILVRLYVYAFTIMIRWIMTIVILTWRPLVTIAFLVFLSSATYQMMKKLYSFIQIWWVLAPLLVMFRLAMYLRRRLFPNRGDEKMVAGFKSFAVPMTPPGHAVLEIVHPDDSHMGYASCVRLKNGEEALLTSVHCINETFKVRSLRNGVKIPLTEFQVLLPAKNIDLVLLRGPPEWKSILGAKAAHFTPANQLNKGAVSIFVHDGEWKMHNAKVTGTDGFYATVLSNTEKGFSGAPYWNGKSIVGVHKGYVYGDDSKNYNLMAPIPPVVGLTAPAFVYESPSLQGDVFSDADVSDMADYAEEVYEKALAEPKVWKPASGKYWWEMAEEEDDFVVEAKPPPPESPVEKVPGEKQTPACTVEKASTPVEQTPVQGNEPSGADHLKTPESTPLKPDESTKELLNNIVSQLIQKIDLSSIATRVEEKLLQKAQNKQQQNGGKKSPRKRKTSNTSSKPPTNGKSPPVISPVQEVRQTPSAIPSPKTEKHTMGGAHHLRTPRDGRPKSPDSGGLSSAPKPKRQV
uniref:Multifunctional protein n=2 Tax=Sugarcane yellow leaf virus TaxID=94290 RepID=M4GJY9_9VIRU|nr:multifunctional protein [Sugarcane yellow leaf virus]